MLGDADHALHFFSDSDDGDDVAIELMPDIFGSGGSVHGSRNNGDTDNSDEDMMLGRGKVTADSDSCGDSSSDCDMVGGLWGPQLSSHHTG